MPASTISRPRWARNLACGAIYVLGIAPVSAALSWDWWGPTRAAPGLEEGQIRKATVSLSVEHVLGWAYEKNVWSRGTPEVAPVGQEGSPDRNNVRAVCLGKEQGYYVFFTLRSFIDPFYPNPAIQGVTDPPLGPDGVAVKLGGAQISDSDAMRDARLVRYGTMRFARYEDMGGGKFRVAAKAEAVTIYDAMPEGPVTLNRGMLGFGGAPEETHGGGKFSRPHESISVEEHFRRLELGQAGGALFRFVGKHDVALIYVPEAAFDGKDSAPVPTLGIDRPSVAVDLCLQQSRSLFGFDFLLMGQETLDRIQGYRPPRGGEFPGFERLGGILGLAMDPQTLMMIKAVDSALVRVLPRPEAVKNIRDLWSFWNTIRPDDLGKIAKDLFPMIRGKMGLSEAGR